MKPRSYLFACALVLAATIAAACGSSASTGGTADASAGGGACMISASTYDQTCATDGDCALVTEGDYCDGGSCPCPTGAVRISAFAQYAADLARTPLGSGAAVGAACHCVPPVGPCCRSGQCTAACWSPSDTLPPCADAGGLCSPPGIPCGGMNGSHESPLGSCKYPDEMCCF